MKQGCLALLALIGAGVAHAEPANPRAVVLVFARGGASAQAAVRIERDLRNMYDYSAGAGVEGVPRTLAVEPRYDVGNLSKGELEKARRHFNDAQRALEQGDAEEANEQLFRAQRFYNKAIPYASDQPLVKGIFYYYYLAHKAAGADEKARDAYCTYVGLTRNLAGSAGPIEQFEPLADKCGETTVAGTGELRVTSNIDGAHVYVDDRAVGVIGRDVPWVDPFAPAGPHLVEVRKAGYARWGTLVTLRNGGSESQRAKLKEARNRAEEFDPLADMPFEGDDAYSEDYIADLLFQMADKFNASELVSAYLEPSRKKGQLRLTVFCFGAFGVERTEYTFRNDEDAHRKALTTWWDWRAKQALDPADAVPAPGRFAPTLFKVE